MTRRKLNRALDLTERATVELSEVYAAPDLGPDDTAELRELYAELTRIAGRLRELAQRATS